MVGESNSELRSHHQAEPWKPLVPPLLLMLTTEPIVWPLEASNDDVCTLNSWMEACGGENATRTLTLSEKVFVMPSMLNSLLKSPLPSVENCEGALLKGALRKRISVPLTVPGARSVNSMALPEKIGNSITRRSSTT